MRQQLKRILDRHDWLRTAEGLHVGKGPLSPVGFCRLIAELDDNWTDDPDYLGSHTHRLYLAEFILGGDRWGYSGAVAYQDGQFEYQSVFLRNGLPVNVREFRALQDSLPIGRTHTERLSSGL